MIKHKLLTCSKTFHAKLLIYYVGSMPVTMRYINLKIGKCSQDFGKHSVCKR